MRYTYQRSGSLENPIVPGLTRLPSLFSSTPQSLTTVPRSPSTPTSSSLKVLHSPPRIQTREPVHGFSALFEEDTFGAHV
jgi:hypothetical protein